jgi:nitric oxide reductase large subunit
MATAASLASASLFMLGGIPGTFHHMYFAGTTTPVMAVGASFSALEVVPLIVLGHEAWENWRLKARAPWMEEPQVAADVLRRRGVLEHAGRRCLRLHDQPAARCTTSRA